MLEASEAPDRDQGAFPECMGAEGYLTQTILGMICIPLAYMAAYSFLEIIDYKAQRSRLLWIRDGMDPWAYPYR